jgi:bifunctional DNA-binding transcriptional regulator/antitoxin component of YhaV-PrlF toxin-antitoxin module
MTYQTIITSKGTTTIPVAVRKSLGLKPGMRVSFVQDVVSGKFELQRAHTIEEIRAINRAALKATLMREYKSGDGFTEFVTEKYGV